MRRLAVLSLLAAAAIVCAACSLNPQPFPPSGTDFTGSGTDASVDTGTPPFGDDAGADGATMQDSGSGDASVEGGAEDASADAATDAATDAESDATGD